MKIKNIIFLTLLLSASLHAGTFFEMYRLFGYWGVRSLVALGYDVNDVEDHRSLLWHVVSRSDAKMVALLLENGAQIQENDLVHMAAKEADQWVLVELLKHKVPANQKDEEGCLPIHHAVSCRSLKEILYQESGISDESLRAQRAATIKLLLEANPESKEALDKDGYKPLRYAVYYGNEHTIKELLDAGADCIDWGNKGSTWLHDSLPGDYVSREQAVVLTKNLGSLLYFTAINNRLGTLLHARNAEGKTGRERARAMHVQDIYEKFIYNNPHVREELNKRNNIPAFLSQRAIGMKPRLK